MEKIKLFLELRKAECKEKAERLTQDHREDEAVFEKVRENVYDIFSTVLNVAKTQCGGDREKAEGFFGSRLEQIPAAWEQSLEKARQHGDEKKAYMEEVKLGVIAEIRKALEG